MGLSIGLVIALHSEAVCLGGRGGWRHTTGNPPIKRSVLPDGTVVLMACSGMGVEKARCAARALVAQGAGGLIGIGVSAGLQPELKPGDLVVADRLVLAENGTETGAWRTDAAITGRTLRQLAAAGLAARCGTLVTVSRPVFTPGQKQAAGVRFGAAALDMESAAVAKTAAEAGLPFFAVRAVSDTVIQQIPARLFSCLDAFGRLRPTAFCREMVISPSLVPRLAALAANFRVACRSLKSGWSVLRASGLADLIAPHCGN